MSHRFCSTRIRSHPLARFALYRMVGTGGGYTRTILGSLGSNLQQPGQPESRFIFSVLLRSSVCFGVTLSEWPSYTLNTTLDVIIKKYKYRYIYIYIYIYIYLTPSFKMSHRFCSTPLARFALYRMVGTGGGYTRTILGSLGSNLQQPGQPESRFIFSVLLRSSVCFGVTLSERPS